MAAAEARFLAIDVVGKGGEASRGSVVWVLARREGANEGCSGVGSWVVARRDQVNDQSEVLPPLSYRPCRSEIAFQPHALNSVDHMRLESAHGR